MGYRPDSPDKIIKCDFGNRVNDFFRARFKLKHSVSFKCNESFSFIHEIECWADDNLKSGWRIIYYYRPTLLPQGGNELTFEMVFANPAEATRFKLEFV